ncbi:MAG: hypothetical protein IMZ64_00570, partial [Bacteroidetes bacterium]|nr:hypothetical protein [Bacteroidota bacterium]
VTEEKLISNGIINIDKKLEFDIHRYAINYKTGNTYFNEIMNKVDKESLLNDWLLIKKSWAKKAAELKVPLKIFSGVMHSIVPVFGSEEFYNFLMNRMVSENYIKEQFKKGRKIKFILKSLNNVTHKRNRLLVNRLFREQK